jgi:hypothetical protein
MEGVVSGSSKIGTLLIIPKISCLQPEPEFVKTDDADSLLESSEYDLQ